MMVANELTWQANVAANLREARKRNGRLGSLKSRGGCLTCKQRRVKCDESHPECRRCISTGRQCAGYVALKVRNKGSPVSGQLLLSLGLDKDDSRRLDFFLSRAAPRLAGSFDKDFWCGSLLQVAQSEPIILDCLLAISTLYEHPQFIGSFDESEYGFEILNGGLDTTFSDQLLPIDKNHVDAIKIYNRAIRGLKQRMNEGKATTFLALVSCILFICIETMRDHVSSAMMLFETGMDMLRKHSGSRWNSSEDVVMRDVRQIFARLGVLLSSFGYTQTSLPQPHDVPRHVDGRFESMAQARDGLFAVLAHGNSLRAATNEWRTRLFEAERQHELLELDRARTSTAILGSDKNPSLEQFLEKPRSLLAKIGGSYGLGKTVDYQTLYVRTTLSEEELEEGPIHGPDHPEPDNTDAFQRSLKVGLHDCFMKLKTLQLHHLCKLSKWRQAFECFRESQKGTACDTASYLLTIYYTTLIFISTQLSACKTAFDQYAPEFGELVYHAEKYLESNASERPVFSFDFGVIPALYFTASECRVPSIRRKALALLKLAPKKESLLAADNLAQLCSRLISIEERGLGLPDPMAVDDSVLPGAHERVHMLRVLKNDDTRSFELRIIRQSEVDGHFQSRAEHFPL